MSDWAATSVRQMLGGNGAGHDDGRSDDLPAPYPATDEEEPSKYHDFAEALLRERHEALAGERAQWWQNMLFAEGHQWWDYEQGKYVFRGGPKWKKYPVRNRLQPYLRMLVAKLTKNRPQTSSMPATSDTKDIQAAKLADKVLEAKWRELDQTARIREVVAWTGVTGSAWVMPFWNTDTGKMVPLVTQVAVTQIDPETGMESTQLVEAPCDETGAPIMDGPRYDLEAEPAWVDEGDIALRVFGPHRVYPDRSAECEADIRSVVIVEPMEVRDIVAKWPQMRAAQVSPGSVVTSEMESIPTYVDGERPMADVDLSGSRGDGERAAVLYYYERPSREWPHGRSWVTVDGKVVEEPTTLPDGMWPVVYLMKDQDVPGRLLGRANVTVAIGLQREYNKYTQQIAEHNEQMLKGVWLVPRSANIAKGDIDTREPGALIPYYGIQKPEMADLKALPPKVYEDRMLVAEDMNHMLGVHRASMGKADPGITAGRAILALQEADDSDLAPMTERLESVVARIGAHFLRLIQVHYDAERTIQYIGPNKVYRYAAFRGADLSGVADVVPVVGSAYPWSKSAMLTHTLEMMERLPMLFMNPETGMMDNDRVRRALSLGVEDVVDRGFEADHDEIQREHMKFETWDPQTAEELAYSPAYPEIWQNHAVHIQQHSTFMKDREFEAWPPFRRKALTEHLFVHQQLLQAMLAPMMEQGHQDAGGPGGSPKSSQAAGLPPTQGAVLHSTETNKQGPANA